MGIYLMLIGGYTIACFGVGDSTVSSIARESLKLTGFENYILFQMICDETDSPSFYQCVQMVGYRKSGNRILKNFCEVTEIHVRARGEKSRKWHSEIRHFLNTI